MLSTAELIDLARHRAGDVSDYRIAQLLGLKPNQISMYRRTATKPSNPVAMRLDELAGVDPMEAVASVNLERASSPEERAVWETMLHRLAAQSRAKRAS